MGTDVDNSDSDDSDPLAGTEISDSLSVGLDSLSELFRSTVANPIFTQKNREEIGKYKVRETIGSGGQSVVFLAFDPDLQRGVVIKIYHTAYTRKAQKRVLLEGQMLAKIDSPYVARCYAVDRIDEIPYLVTEYVAGNTLADEMRSKNISTKEAFHLISCLAHGIQETHRCGVVHRDIKPANIIIDQKGNPKLIDFGISHSINQTKGSKRLGTPAYMAPEVARGDMNMIDHRADIFSLGAVFYELTCGFPPFAADTRSEELDRSRNAAVQPLAKVKPGTPSGINFICMTCLAESPNERFRNADQLIHRLEVVSQRIDVVPIAKKFGMWFFFIVTLILFLFSISVLITNHLASLTPS